MRWRHIILLALLSFCGTATAELKDSLSEDLIDEVFDEGVTLDLRHPLYSDGILTTSKGGVITAPNIRIQAQNIVYIKKQIDGESVFRVEAEGNLMLEYHQQVFVGERMEYDFNAGEGYLYSGRGTIAPWYFGGEVIHLRDDKSYCINNAFVTTSPNQNTDWEILSSEVTITDNSRLHASNVQFRFVNLPLFWIPSYRANLNSMWRMPIRVGARWSGKLGPRIGMSYLIYGNEEWQTFFLLDYSFVRGFGGGLETDYNERGGVRKFSTRSYIANDNSVEEENRRERYRLQGAYHDELACGFSIDLAYDKLSDKWMATDYYQKGFESRAIGRSELLIRQKSSYWMASIFAHARLNDFQSVKQELPTFSLSIRPLNLFTTGIISDTSVRASYLAFRYDKDLVGVTNFHSTRYEMQQAFYRAFRVGPVKLTPEVGTVAIHYDNSPMGAAADQMVGHLGFHVTTALHRYYGPYKHSIEPYTGYDYYSASSIPTVDHYLFDIDDGWNTLNTLRFGLKNTLFVKKCDGSVRRHLYGDIYANAFFNTANIDNTIPYIHTRLYWHAFDRLRYLTGFAWDTARKEIAYYNLRTDCTVNTDLAFSMEFRHRSNYSWRKVDGKNFFVDTFHSDAELRMSSLSDQRNAFLTHIFYRYCPTWAAELKTRHGWNRIEEDQYAEFQIDLHGKLRGGWLLRLSFQRRENDDRFTVNIGLGAKSPSDKICPPADLARGNF